MSKPSKVVVDTGAPQCIGAEVVRAYRKFDCRVVATSRSIKSWDDKNIVNIAGDITDAILFVDCAPFTTGEILHVNGGLSAGR